MPALGSSAYAQVSTITQAVRSLLNDVPGTVFSDNFLLPFFNLAYNDMWAELENNGSETLIEDEYFFVVAGISGEDPSAQVIVSDTAQIIEQAGGAVTFNEPTLAAPPNVLPLDIYRPIKLWERLNGTSFGFVEMDDRSAKGGLPAALGQGSTALLYWEWRDDGLAFLGATSDVQIRMRYQKMLMPASDPTASIGVRNGVNYLTYQTAFLAQQAHKGAAAAAATGYQAVAAESLNKMVIAIVRTQQKPVRRRAHSRGNRRGWL